jgi:hypothetical protein
VRSLSAFVSSPLLSSPLLLCSALLCSALNASVTGRPVGIFRGCPAEEKEARDIWTSCALLCSVPVWGACVGAVCGENSAREKRQPATKPRQLHQTERNNQGSNSHTNTTTLEVQLGLIRVPSFSPLLHFLRKGQTGQTRASRVVERLASWFLALLQRAPPQTVAHRQGYTVMCPLLRTVMALFGYGSLSGLASGSLGGTVGARRAPSVLRLPQSAPLPAVARATRVTPVRVPA